MPDEPVPVVPRIEPTGDVPGSYAHLEQEHRARFPLPAVLTVVGWGLLSYAVVAILGVGGWRGGWFISLVMWVIGLAALTWRALRTVIGRGLYVAAAAIAGLVISVQLVQRAPQSASRLEARVDHMGIGNLLWTTVSMKRSGHGWCIPHCPEVVRVYRAPNDSLRTGLVVALSALHSAGLEPDIKGAYGRLAGTVITRRGDGVIATLSVAEVDGRVQLTVDLLSQ